MTSTQQTDNDRNTYKNMYERYDELRKLLPDAVYADVWMFYYDGRLEIETMADKSLFRVARETPMQEVADKVMLLIG